MQDPSSYVYSGKDDSGAATVLKPFESDIYKDYIARRKKPPVKNALLDSLGRDILTLGNKVADPRDRMDIDKELKSYIDYVSKLSADNTDLMNSPDELYQVTQKRGRVTDLTSKSLRTTTAYKTAEEKYNANPAAYPDNTLEIIKQAWDLGVENRPATPPIERLKPANFIKYFKDMGATLEKPYYTKRADGKVDSGVMFNEAELPEVWKTVFDTNKKDPEFRRFMATVKEDVRDLANLQGKNFDQLPMEQQAQLVYAEGMKQFGDIKQSQIKDYYKGTDAPDTEARKTAAKGKAQQDAIQQGYVVTARTVKNKDGDFDIKKVQSWVIANKETGNPADNTPMTFEGGVIGSPQRVENIEGSSTPILVVRTGNGSTMPYEMVEIPLTPINSSKLKAEYGFDWDKIKKDPVFVKKYEDFDVNKLTVKDFTDAAGSERNPASEAATQKALDKRKGVKVTAPKADAAPAEPAGSTKRYDPKTGKFIEYTPKK